MGTGTGKTITSLERFKQNPTKNLLVICPRSVIEQWADVIEENYGDLRVTKFKRSWASKRKNQHIREFSKTNNVTIVNFEILYKLDALEDIVDNDWTIVIDESHRIKSLGTKKSPVRQTAAALHLGQLTEWKMILTATPTQGNFGGYIDYFSQLKFLGYMDMDIDEFKREYVIEEKKHLRNRPYPIKVIVGYKNTDKLDKLLQLTCRRYVPKYKDYEPEHIKVKITRTKSYPKTKREMVYQDILLDNSARKRIGLKTLTGGRIMGKNEFGERFIYDDNTEKIDWVLDKLKDTDGKMTIFYTYNVERDLLRENLEKAGYKVGVIDSKTKNKYQVVNDGDYDVLIGQYQAMSESLDGMQNHVHLMVLYSMPESSLKYTQAIGRIDRIGQKFVPMYYYLVMEKTVDEDVYSLIEQKVEYSEVTLEKLLINL